jgi:hypothetical protein
VRFSIRWKLILAIGLPLLLVYAVMLTVTVRELGRRAHGEMVGRVDEFMSLHAARAGTRFRGIARVTENTAATIASLPALSPQQLERMLGLVAVADEMVQGARLVLDDGNPSGPSICESVAQAVGEFQTGKLHDDVTVMVLGRKAAHQGPD